jgi:hypothetical protein
MCQDIQQLTYACGHQAHYLTARSRFCLFRGPASTRFHTTYLYYDTSDEICPRCGIRAWLKEEGVVLPPEQYKEKIEENLEPDTRFAESEAARFETGARRALEAQSPAQMTELNMQVKEQIAFYLGKENVTPGAKVVLLRTVTMLPESFDLRQLVLFLGSRYFSEKDTTRQMQDWERRKNFATVRHVGLEITFKAGMALKTPLPLPAPRAAKVSDNKGQPPAKAKNGQKATGTNAQAKKDAAKDAEKDLAGKVAKMSLK